MVVRRIVTPCVRVRFPVGAPNIPMVQRLGYVVFTHEVRVRFPVGMRDYRNAETMLHGFWGKVQFLAISRVLQQ